ncbi:hypothetical protein [Enterovirga aerilata]|nr:hypothetical protein [Enterovirga sp. DB1703]
MGRALWQGTFKTPIGPDVTRLIIPFVLGVLGPIAIVAYLLSHG